MPPLKAPAAPAPSVPSPARAEKRPLVEGSKVRVDGLTGAKHLPGPQSQRLGEVVGSAPCMQGLPQLVRLGAVRAYQSRWRNSENP